MKRHPYILGLFLCLAGCAKQDTVVIDAVRNGRHIIKAERISTVDLGPRLLSDGFSTNTRVYMTGRVPADPSRLKGDSIFLNADKTSSHQHIRNIMDELVQHRIGTWPDYFTGIRKDGTTTNSSLSSDGTPSDDK